MNLIFNFSNSPYFLGSLFILLLFILYIINPLKQFFKFLSKKIREYKIRNRVGIKKEIVKVIKVESTKNDIFGYWEKISFFIIGIGIIFTTYFKNWDFFIFKYKSFYDFIFLGTNHKNLTTIIVSLLISFVLLLLIKLIGILRKKRTINMKIIHYIIFSLIVSFLFIILTKSIIKTELSLINSIIMGITFIIFGLLIKRKN